MNHIQQPKDSKLCGQCCVAMWLGITMEESIKKFKSISGTRTRQVCEVLEIPYSRLVRVKDNSQLPENGILKVIWKLPKGSKFHGGHWILKVGDVIHDPSVEYEVPLHHYLSWLDQQALKDVPCRISAYLRLQ